MKLVWFVLTFLMLPLSVGGQDAVKRDQHKMSSCIMIRNHTLARWKTPSAW
jgi:hypothetical protein